MKTFHFAEVIQQ